MYDEFAPEEFALDGEEEETDGGIGDEDETDEELDDEELDPGMDEEEGV